MVGAECGGHPGESALGTMVFIPEVVEQVSRPVIAGGGFCDGRTLAAGLALGADCVNMGTRFILSKECTAHPHLKESYQQASCTDTMIVMESLRNPGRVLSTRWAERVKELEQEGAGPDELRPVISGAITQKGWLQGTVDEGLYYCGQVVGRCHDLLSVREIIENTVAQAEAIIERLRQGKEAGRPNRL